MVELGGNSGVQAVRRQRLGDELLALVGTQRHRVERRPVGLLHLTGTQRVEDVERRAAGRVQAEIAVQGRANDLPAVQVAQTAS